MYKVGLIAGSEASQAIIETEECSGVEGSHSQRLLAFNFESRGAIAHRFIHREIGAGKRVIRELQAAVPQPYLAALEQERLRSAGGGRHGVGDEEKPAFWLCGDRQLERHGIDMMTIGDDAAIAVAIGERYSDHPGGAHAQL